MGQPSSGSVNAGGLELRGDDFLTLYLPHSILTTWKSVKKGRAWGQRQAVIEGRGGCGPKAQGRQLVNCLLPEYLNYPFSH